MHIRRKLIAALTLVLLIVALMTPLTLRMSGELAAQRAADERLLDMHVRHSAHREQGFGGEVLPVLETEELWAIEDSRTESDRLLVDALYCGSHEAGLDEVYSTFYVSVEPGQADWPELPLTARGGEDVQVAWIDDYTYDWCDEAVAQGYDYELIAYTPTEYCYLYVVFTGMPVVTLHTQEAVGDTYIPCRTTLSAAGYEPVDSASLVHTRGGGFYKGIDKESYRVEFHGVSSSGKDRKTPVSVLGMPEDTDWLLVSNAGDATAMRNELCFALWRRWNGEEHTVMALDSRLVEVFVNDEYMGLYQLMPRVRADEELSAMGGNLETDISARMIGERYETGKPLFNAHELIDGVIELRYAPAGMSAARAFDRYQPYISMNLPEENPDYLSNEEFVRLALAHGDVEDTMSYYLFMQATTMTLDNVKNNLYIWTLEQGDTYRYRFSPWDMDSCVKPLFSSDASMFNFLWPIAMRMLDNNVGDARQVARDLWEERRATILSDDALYQWFDDWEHAVNATGAFLRETERWRGGAVELDLSELSVFMIEHMSYVERILYDTWPLDVPAIYAE